VKVEVLIELPKEPPPPELQGLSEEERQRLNEDPIATQTDDDGSMAERNGKAWTEVIIRLE